MIGRSLMVSPSKFPKVSESFRKNRRYASKFWTNESTHTAAVFITTVADLAQYLSVFKNDFRGDNDF